MKVGPFLLKERSVTSKSLSLPTIIDGLVDAIDRLESLGIRARNSRIGQYQRTMEKLQMRIGVSKFPLFLSDEDAGVYSNTICDSLALIEVFHSFKEIPSELFLAKLKEVVSGPSEVSKERSHNSSNRARNTLFELTVAARLQRAGFSPALEAPTDVVGRLNTGLVFIECKRLQEEHQLNSRLREGVKKVIEAKDAYDGKSAGFIALSVGKAEFRGERVVVADQEDHLNSICEKLCDRFYQAYERRFRSAFKKGIDGVIIVTTFPAWIGKTAKIVPSDYMSFRVSPSLSSSIGEELNTGLKAALRSS